MFFFLCKSGVFGDGIFKYVVLNWIVLFICNLIYMYWVLKFVINYIILIYMLIVIVKVCLKYN